MLNLPALTLSIASLFHLRCYLENSGNDPEKHFCISLALAFLSIFSHPTIGVVFPIAITWLIIDRKWKWIFDRRIQVTLIVGVLASAILYAALYHLSRVQFSQAAVSTKQLRTVYLPVFYIRSIQSLISGPVLGLAIAGWLYSVQSPAFRKDAIRMLCATTVVVFLLQSIWAKDSRYILWACPAATYLVAQLYNVCQKSDKATLTAFLSNFCLIALFCYLFINNRAPLKTVNEFKTIAEFIVKESPRTPVLYHGVYDGTTISYLRLLDDQYQHQIVRLENLLALNRSGKQGDQLRWLGRRSADSVQGNDFASNELQQAIRNSKCSLFFVEQSESPSFTLILNAINLLVKSGELKQLCNFQVDMKTQKLRVSAYQLRSSDHNSHQPRTKTVPILTNGRMYYPVKL